MRLANFLLLLTVGKCAAQAVRTQRLEAVVQSIEVPAGQHLVLRAEAEGVQVYRCDKHEDGAEWTFVAPEAKLFVEGVAAGSHGAGPVWRNVDGSAVWGQVFAKTPSTHADSIPQLLLKAVKTEGTGVFSGVEYIQRIQTDGGNAPVAGCDVGHVGAEMRTHYTAWYLFYSAGSR